MRFWVQWEQLSEAVVYDVVPVAILELGTYVSRWGTVFERLFIAMRWYSVLSLLLYAQISSVTMLCQNLSFLKKRLDASMLRILSTIQ